MLLGEEPKPTRPKIHASAVALPNEHGSWGFLLEPLVAGLAIAPSSGAPWIALLAIGAFLMRQPIKVIFAGGIAARDRPQARMAIRFIIAFALVFFFGAIGCVFFVRPISLIPFVIALPFASYQIICDANRKSRNLLAEIFGSIAISSPIAVMAMADNWPISKAAAIWSVMIVRLIPSILYVRNRLNLEKGKVFSRILPVGTHICAFLLITVLAINGLIPYLPVLMFAVLLIRSIIGLSPLRRRVKAMKIGIGEVIYGTLTVASLVAGYYLQF